MNAEAIRSEMVRLGPWHHDVEVVPGVRTGEKPPPGIVYPAELGTPEVFPPEVHFNWLIPNLFEGGFAGRSFLDCGCNGGGYLYSAKALGAGRVLGFDVRDHWIEQARFLGRHLPSEGVETAVCDLADLAKRAPEPFDVTLFNGLFYHLPDPMAGLRIAADLTKELIIVNTAILPSDGDCLVLAPESKIQVMSGVHGLAWLPTNERVVAAALAWCGFPHWRVSFENRGYVKGWRRVEILAAREASTFDRWDSRIAPVRTAASRRPSLARRALMRLARKL